MERKKHEKKVKKEKSKDKVEEKKSIALKTSNSNPSHNKQSDCETKDDKYFDEEDLGLFIKKFNRYMWKHGDKYSEKNQSKSRRLSNFSKEDENKKGNPRSLCYNRGKASHYRPKYPMSKKDLKKKYHHKKSSKSRRVYVAWESKSDYSRDESSNLSVELAKI